jgi:transposase
LDEQVEEESWARVISQAVDQRMFDVAIVFDAYSGRGSAAHSPDLLLKLALYEHSRGRTKPIQWYRDLKRDLYVQWLVFGMKVSRTALYNFRDRVGPLIKQWNEQVVDLAVSEKLVEGCQASLDGTTVAANTSRRKLGNMQQVNKRLALLEQALQPTPSECGATAVDTSEQSPEPGWMAKTVRGKWEQHGRYSQAKERLATLLKENEARRSDKRKPQDKIVVSLTDPESIFSLDKEKVYRPLYNVQTVSDLPTDFVLSYEVFVRHADTGTLQPMVNQTHETSVRLKDLLTDAGYPTGEDLKFCERSGLTLYAPWQENSSTTKKKQQQPRKTPVEKAQFQWDGARGVYICPEHKELSFSHKNSRQRASGELIPFDVYRASPSDCTACPLRASCTTVPEKGRTVRRDRHQEEIDRLRGRMETEEAKSLYKQRGQTIERVFGDFKEHRNLRRFRGRGIARARTQLGLTVLAHNVRIILKLREQRKQEAEHGIVAKTAA